MLPLDPERYRVPYNASFSLSERIPNDTQGWTDESAADDLFDTNRKRLARLQERLYAEHKQSLLIVLQAMDTAGKDSTIRNVTKGINPPGCHVVSFKAPSKR